MLGIFIAINYFPKETLAEEMAAIQKSDHIVVSNPKTPAPKDGLEMRIVFEEELSIGVEEGDKNYMFGNNVAFNTDEEGNFYVTNWDRKRIHKFDPQGNCLLTIGRRGQGPGEFQNISVAKFDKDNNIYVTDIVSRRITFFDKEGKLLRLITSPVRLSHNLYINSKGFFIFRQSKYLEYPNGVEELISIYGLFDDKFNLIAEIHKEMWESKPPLGRDEKSLAQAQADVISGAAFKPSISYMLDEDGNIYFGYSEKYEINVYSPEAKLIKIIQREYDPIKVSKKDREIFANNWEEEIFKFVPISDDIKKKAFKLAKYPKYKPAYKRFNLMENRWLFEIVDAIKDEYTLIDIFDQEGKYIAQFKASIPSEWLIFKNGKAYTLAIENDYRFVKRYNFEIQEYKNNRRKRKK